MSHRCGYVAIVGRPNVGKSTLLNQLVGTKIAIVTPKPQTTRRRILGVRSSEHAQLLFVDTPGWHAPRSLINQRMVQNAESALSEADVVLWVVDGAAGLENADELMRQRLADARQPLCIAVNKIDRQKRGTLLPLLTDLAERHPGAEIVPVSAATGENVDGLVAVLERLLPEGPALYDEDTYTDQSERMLVEECVREQILLQLREEIPYVTGVTIEKFEDKGGLAVVSATIQVERKSQKAVVVGARGSRIKEIGSAARLEAERILGRRLFLELFVRVDADWTRNPRRLDEMGL